MTPVDRRLFAFRRYHGIGPEGRHMDEWTQQEIADYLDVSRQAVNRWLNRETFPLAEELSYCERITLYSIAVTGSAEDLQEYFILRAMTERTQSESPNQEQSLYRISLAESDTQDFDPALGKEYSPW
ncbi:helix-turn-helix domain-containing protein [Haloferax volcanii]|uniref:helix-turn-helix domain-containing protein n=1 Tax=Haloferax volcanii TaxID=2246 RepID=UPI003859C062